MSSAFERMQKIAEEKRLREKSEKSHLELVEDKLPIQPILSNDSPSNPTLPLKLQKSTAPSKDFQRVPNSITRDAVPNKLFKGASKNTYDALYLRTRGAINPIRTIRATKRELMKWVGISHITIFKHIKHLESVGLIKIEQRVGSHEGSIYEVLIPEEVLPEQSITSWSNDNPSNPILSNTTQPILANDSLSNKVVSVPYNKVVLDRMGKVIENKDTYGIPKTSLKHNTISDDETFAPFIEKFQSINKEITGRELSPKESESLANLADLLILELKTAARRTNNISNVPAFLTEVLRRQFFASRQQQQTVSKSSKAKKDTVGKPEAESYEIKPLDAKGREEALAQLREFADDDFLEDFKKWYTAEDWSWLIKELKVKK